MAATVRTVLIIAQTVVVVLAGVVIIRVTACAVGLVSGRRPAYGFGIRRMASSAREIDAVIQRFVSQACMAEISGKPCDRAVAKTAILCGIEMARVLAGCRRAVMAG